MSVQGNRSSIEAHDQRQDIDCHVSWPKKENSCIYVLVDTVGDLESGGAHTVRSTLAIAWMFSQRGRSPVAGRETRRALIPLAQNTPS